MLADYAGGLVADRGGPDVMTSGEARMIELAQLARGCTLLILAEAARGSGIAGSRRSVSLNVAGGTRRLSDPDLAAALARFMAVEAGALKVIGLDRRAKPVPSLADILARRAGERDGEAAS